MAFVRPAIYDNAVVRQPQQGDLIANSEAILPVTSTAVAFQLTGSALASGIISRSGPAAAYADIFPTPVDLLSALLNNVYVGGGAVSPIGIQQFLSFRLRFINSVAFANTLTAPTGVTLGGVTAISASSVKDYLVTITNGAPQVIYSGNVTSGSAVLSNFFQTAMTNITIGALVSGTGIPAGATVIGIGNNNSITLSANATATTVNTALTFSPTYRVDSIGQGLL